MKKNLFLLLFLIVLLVAYQIKILACGCPTLVSTEEKVKWELKDAQAVFTGKVTDISRIAHTPDVLVQFEIDEFWKEKISNVLSVKTNQNSIACGYPFETGQSFLVFAYKSDNEILSTGLCLSNKKITKADEELKILGTGKKPVRKTS